MEAADRDASADPVQPRIPAPVPVAVRARRRFQPRRLPLEGRKWAAVATLTLCAVLAIVCASSVLDLREALTGLPRQVAEDADAAFLARLTTIGERVDSLAAAAFAARVVCAIAFLMWFYRAHENLRLGGLPIERTSGFAVGSFFIPVVNLVLPCIAAMETWKGSRALAGESTLADWRRRAPSPLVLLWWVAFAGALVLGAVAGRLASEVSRWDGGDPSAAVARLMAVPTWVLASRALEVVAALAGIAMVLRVSALQARSPEAPLAEVFE